MCGSWGARENHPPARSADFQSNPIMSAPLVSVIIPTYNRAATLKRTIDSALAQTYRPLEVIVVDDGSADGTETVMRSYGDRIHGIVQANGGPSAARNAGAKAAKGEWLAFLDSDDVWRPEKIARQVELVSRVETNVDCCMCNAAVIDENGPTGATTFGASGVATDLAEGYWLNPAPLIATRFILFNQVALIRTGAFRKAGGFKQELRLLEDHDLAFRLSLDGPWAFVADPLVEKYNDTVGIGVAAMADPMIHCKAWDGVIRGFLDDGFGTDPRLGVHLRAALREVRLEMWFLRAGRKRGIRGIVSKVGLMVLHKCQSVRRKLPSWPKAEIRSSLQSAREDVDSLFRGASVERREGSV